MTRLSFIYLISFVLLWNLQGNKNYSYEKPFPFIKEKREELLSKFKDPALVELLLSYAVGEYKKVPKEMKDAHKILGLNHLFTPSGIHLSALFILLLPLLFFLKRKNRKYYLAFASFLYLLPVFILPGFYAAKRISLLKFLSLFKRQLSFFTVFLFGFFLDFLLGGYSKAPGSFVYSFLFLGIIFSSEKNPKIFLPLALLGGQILVSYFQQTPLTPLGFLLGFFLTALFTPLFPIYFLYFWLSPFLPSAPAEFFVEMYWKAVLWASQFSLSFGIYYSSVPLILFIFLCSLKLPYRAKMLALAFCFLINAQPLLNAKKTLDLRNKKLMFYALNRPFKASR